MTDIVDRLNDSLSAGYSELRKEAAAEITRLRAKITAMERQEPVAFALYSGWARKAVYLSEIEACEQRDHRQLTADLGGSLEVYRVAPLYLALDAQLTQRMDMQTADQITQAFKSELQALLDKYGAELSARDMWEGYPECGEDVRMLVDVPAIYDADHNCLREYTEIDLGSLVLSTQAMPKEAKP